MKRIPVSLLILLLGGACGLLSRSAHASAQLFPLERWSSTPGEPLPTRLVKVDAEVFHGLARVHTEYRFDNDREDQIEGLLRTRIPRGAVVTDFAYYYKGARVPGRLMENEEAEAIYRTITSRGRDPGIFRRKGKGVYEARLFPIEPKSELRVEMEYRYQVPEVHGQLKLFYPLTAGLQKQSIGRVELHVRLLGDPLAKVTASDGEARVQARDRAEVVWTADKVTPKHDPAITATLAADTPRREELVSRNATGELFRGWRVREVLRPVARTGYLPAPGFPGSTVRYAFSRSRAGTPGKAEGFSLAQFWAQAQVQQLLARDPKPKSARTRAKIVDLSRTYRIDTQLTSYLAVPDSEWAGYEATLEQQKRAPVEQYLRLAESRYYALQLPGTVTSGDPVIRVPNRPGLTRVVAVLPDGDLLPMRLDAQRQVWEGRFDIPEGTPEGEYRVTLYLFDADGRHELTLNYRVDLTAPTGALDRAAGRLRITASPDTARVVVFWKDGSRQDLSAGAVPGQFEAPLAGRSGPARVRIYDRVHNWIELEEDTDGPATRR